MNNDNRNTNAAGGVVSICDPKEIIEEWRDIPGFSNYEASSLGLVRRKDKSVTSKMYTIATTIGSYFRVSAVSDDRTIRSKELHHLVCLAFHGLPPVHKDRKKYEVNHKDGNKHNTLPDNLEWMTRGENIAHAYETGLRTDNTPVYVMDINTGERKRYSTIAAVGRLLGLKPNVVCRIIVKHRHKPYLDRYLFEKDFSDRKIKENSRYRDLIAHDVVKNKIIVAADLPHLEHLTGVKKGTIREYLIDPVRKDRLLAGYVFRYLGDNEDPLPKHSKKDAKNSREEYFSKKEQAPAKYGVLVKDYINNRVDEYRTLEDAAEATGVDKGTIRYLINTLKRPRLFRGLAFKYTDSDVPWIDYDPEVALISKDVKKPEYPLVRVFDSLENTTRLYPNMGTFVKGELGMSSVQLVTKHLSKDPGFKYKNRYSFEYVYL